MRIDIYQNRSVTACLREAFRLVTRQWKSLLKCLWAPFLAVAIMQSASVIINMPNKALHDWGEDNPMTSFLLQTVLYVLILLADIWYSGAYYSWINERKIGYNMWRYIKITVSYVLVFGVLIEVVNIAFTPFSIMMAANVSLLHIIAKMLVLAAVGFIFTPPLFYVIIKYMLDEDARLKHIGRYLSTGFRHWGTLFGAMLIYFILAFCIVMITGIPIVVLMIASSQAQLGALDGDALTLPGFFYILMFVVTTISLVVILVMSVWLGIAFCYQCGSITSKENEKKKLKLQSQKFENNEENTVY